MSHLFNPFPVMSWIRGASDEELAEFLERAGAHLPLDGHLYYGVREASKRLRGRQGCAWGMDDEAAVKTYV